MRPRFFLINLALLVSSVGAGGGEVTNPQTNNDPSLVLAIGAPGEPEYGSNFLKQVQLWTATAARAQAKTTSIGLQQTGASNDLSHLKEILTAEVKESQQPLWIVLVGHGTFDGHEARFNLRGPDLTATEMAEWLAPFRRPVVIINTASSSAPFINKLSATNRVIITSTRSGNERNFARFGQHLAEVLAQPESDLDKDGQTSILEAFLGASARVAEFYKNEGRLDTEHALLDDNGDSLGTPADWFRGVRAIKKPQGSGIVDGARAHQMHLVLSPEEQSLPPEIRSRRDAIELSIAQLRESKSKYPADEYYARLEKFLGELLQAYGDQLK